MQVFKPADILLPKSDLGKWSVVACDQFTSDLGYWNRVRELVGDKPSALKLIIPEAELSFKNAEAQSEKIYKTMSEYLNSGLFTEYPNCFVLVERRQSDGKIRKGLIGMVDLEYYDWSDTATVPVRATEHTVEDRLPPRVTVREKALLEMPHIMLFIDDPADLVIGKAEKGEKLYDFELMQGGGHIAGWLAKDVKAVSASLEALENEDELIRKYGTAKDPILFAMGDGNHSIAAAKKYWESIKPTLSEEERKTHPARYALAELVNLHDEAIGFEPIHKLVFGSCAADFFSEAEHFLGNDPEGDKQIVLVSAEGEKTLRLSGLTIGELIDKCESFCVSYTETHGGGIDYIHGDAELIGFAKKEGSAGILLPRMEKAELFTSVMQSGSFPKKSFSIGHAPDKRYYLECRKIK